MNILNFIKTRKLIFLRTIVVMQEYMPLRKILIERVREYGSNDPNVTESPIVQILPYCEEFGLLENVQNMCGGNVPSKTEWKRLIWEKAW